MRLTKSQLDGRKRRRVQTKRVRFFWKQLLKEVRRDHIRFDYSTIPGHL